MRPTITLTLTLSLLAPVAVSTAPAQADAPARATENRIYFREIEGDDSEIFSIEPDGSDLRRFTDNEAEDLSFSWSPDGTKVAVVREDDVYVLDSSGNELVALGVQPDEVSRNHPLAWSPDGSRIAFVSLVAQRTRLFVVAASGKARPRRVPGVMGAFPVWTINGKRLIFSKRCHKHCPKWADEGDVGMHSITPAGKRLRKLPGTIQLDYPQDMTADGDLLFFRQSAGYAADHEWEMFMLRRGAARPKPIVTSQTGLLAYFSARWSPSGRRVVVIGDETHGAPKTFVQTIRRDGTKERTILECPDHQNGGCPRMVDWTITAP